MKAKHKNPDVDGNDKDKDGNPASSVTVEKKVIMKKPSKSKHTKHVYIPQVWFEGKKMIIRGKAELQQSNKDIFHTLQNQAKAKRNKELKVTTDNEVRSGAQTTLAHFVNVKESKCHKSTSVSSPTKSQLPKS
eukprot:scaffold187001_cov62-Attheya_sp.AAC.4